MRYFEHRFYGVLLSAFLLICICVVGRVDAANTPSKEKSPNGKWQFIVTTTKDHTSTIIIQDARGKRISEKQMQNRGVDESAWTPDSRFVVFTTSSADGHSPWKFPAWCYSVDSHSFYLLDKFFGATTSPKIMVSKPDIVHLTGYTEDKWGEDQPVKLELSTTSGKKFQSKVRETSDRILAQLKALDFHGISEMVDENMGLRFSPYTYLDESDKILFEGDVKKLRKGTRFNWGYYDGSGDPIELSVQDYFKKFIFDHDFTKAPQVSVNKFLGGGNTNNNLREIFPLAEVVDYHFPGSDPKYGGMDWATLRLVLQMTNGKLKLVAVVHDGWTI